jgi:hypothetical protein
MQKKKVSCKKKSVVQSVMQKKKVSCKKKKCHAKKKSVVKKKMPLYRSCKKNFFEKFFALQVIY